MLFTTHHRRVDYGYVDVLMLDSGNSITIMLQKENKDIKWIKFVKISLWARVRGCWISFCQSVSEITSYYGYIILTSNLKRYAVEDWIGIIQNFYYFIASFCSDLWAECNVHKNMIVLSKIPENLRRRSETKLLNAHIYMFFRTKRWDFGILSYLYRCNDAWSVWCS